MKKLILILVVLAVAAPLYAGREIRFSFTDDLDNWDGTCTIMYDVNDLDVAPVAMGLTIEVVSGNPIKDVVCEDENDFFEIFMDAAYSMDPCYTYGAGTPIAKVDVAGETDLATDGGLFAISMGGLGGMTDPDEKAPPKHGTITLYADTGATETEVKVYVNAVRGGIIGEDGEPLVVLGLADDEPAKNGLKRGHVKINECYRESDAVGAWYPVGKPKCWCYPRQCHGDADGRFVGSIFTGYYFVSPDDHNILMAAWKVTEPDFGPGIASIYPGACADFNHARVGSPFTGYYHVSPDDHNILMAYWKDLNPTVPDDCIPNSVEIDPRTMQPGAGPEP